MVLGYDFSLESLESRFCAIDRLQGREKGIDVD